MYKYNTHVLYKCTVCTVLQISTRRDQTSTYGFCTTVYGYVQFIYYISLSVKDGTTKSDGIVRVSGIGDWEVRSGETHAEREKLEQTLAVREVGTRARSHQLQQRLHQQRAAHAHCEPLDRQPLRLLPGRELVRVVQRLRAAFS